MKKPIMQLWTRALRSGEFPQSFGRLESRTGTCALGLLATLAMVAGACDYNNIDGKGLFDGCGNVLPASVVEWAGMNSPNGVMPGDFVTLSGYNDLKRYTFAEIADVIEQNWEVL